MNDKIKAAKAALADAIAEQDRARAALAAAEEAVRASRAELRMLEIEADAALHQATVVTTPWRQRGEAKRTRVAIVRQTAKTITTRYESGFGEQQWRQDHQGVWRPYPAERGLCSDVRRLEVDA